MQGEGSDVWVIQAAWSLLLRNEMLDAGLVGFGSRLAAVDEYTYYRLEMFNLFAYAISAFRLDTPSDVLHQDPLGVRYRQGQ